MSESKSTQQNFMRASVGTDNNMASALLLMCASGACSCSMSGAGAVAHKKGYLTFDIRVGGSRSAATAASQPAARGRAPEPRGRLTQDGLMQCARAAGPLKAEYKMVKGSDGLLYLMNQDEADPKGWLECLVGMRKSLVPILGKLKTAPDNSISSDKDTRLSVTQYNRIARLLNDSTYSGVGSMSPKDLTGFYAVTPCLGSAVFLTSKDYAAKNWRQENVIYLIHELCHAAMGGPPENDAHNLEFFRIMHVLTQAAISLGPSVYNERWYNWDMAQNREFLGGWIGTRKWWEFQRALLKDGNRWYAGRLVRGKDPYVPSSTTLVKVP